MKILLFGSTGLVGTNIESVCKMRDIECISPSHLKVEITRYEVVRGVIKHYQPDVVINTAALIGINLCEEQPERTFEINSFSVFNLAKICKEENITLVQFSTNAVFDGTKENYYTEDDLPHPTSVYGISKYLAEHFTFQCPKHYLIRVPTMFGRRRNRVLGFYDKVINSMKEGKSLRIAYDKIESPSYAWDISEALISLITMGMEKPYGVYHLANQGYVSLYESVIKVAKLLNADIKIEPVEEKIFKQSVSTPLRTALTSNKIDPLRSWEDAMTIFLVKENETCRKNRRLGNR